MARRSSIITGPSGAGQEGSGGVDSAVARYPSMITGVGGGFTGGRAGRAEAGWSRVPLGNVSIRRAQWTAVGYDVTGSHRHGPHVCSAGR